MFPSWHFSKWQTDRLTDWHRHDQDQTRFSLVFRLIICPKFNVEESKFQVLLVWRHALAISAQPCKCQLVSWKLWGKMCDWRCRVQPTSTSTSSVWEFILIYQLTPHFTQININNHWSMIYNLKHNLQTGLSVSTYFGIRSIKVWFKAEMETNFPNKHKTHISITS